MKILIVDDQTVNLVLLRAQLEEQGHFVVEASSGAEGIKALQKQSFDAVISDVLIPGMDGYHLCSERVDNLDAGTLPFLLYYSDVANPLDKNYVLELGVEEPVAEAASEIVLQPAGESELGREMQNPESKEHNGTLEAVEGEATEAVKDLKPLPLTDSLKQSAARVHMLASIVDFSEEAIFSQSLEGEVLSWNLGTARLFGYPPEEAIGMQIEGLIPPDLQEEHRRLMSQIRDGLCVDAFETERVRKDGTRIDVSMRASPLKSEGGEIFGVSIIARDVSREKKMLRDLATSQEHLRAVAARLEIIRENEAIRIARETHGELGHLLTALSMDISWLGERILELGDIEKFEPLLVRVQGISALVENLNFAVQPMSPGFRPCAFDEMGLASALNGHMEDITNRFGISCTWNKKTEISNLPSQIAAAALRVFQEVLTRMARHFGVSSIMVSLRQEGRVIIFEGQSDGSGFEETNGSAYLPSPLQGMHERALLIGAVLKIRTLGEAGAIVSLEVSAGENREALPALVELDPPVFRPVASDPPEGSETESNGFVHHEKRIRQHPRINN